jgi:hypothetical protein
LSQAIHTSVNTTANSRRARARSGAPPDGRRPGRPARLWRDRRRAQAGRPHARAAARRAGGAAARERRSRAQRSRRMVVSAPGWGGGDAPAGPAAGAPGSGSSRIGSAPCVTPPRQGPAKTCVPGPWAGCQAADGRVSVQSTISRRPANNHWPLVPHEGDSEAVVVTTTRRPASIPPRYRVCRIGVGHPAVAAGAMGTEGKGRRMDAARPWTRRRCSDA